MTETKNDETKMTGLEFPELHRPNLSERVMESLLAMIQRGALRSGDRLPSQRQLIKKMGVSASVIREALRGLASLGIIEVAHGRGVFVRSVSPTLLSVRPEFLFLTAQRELLLQAIEVRRILEVEAIGLAAERATPSDLQEMESILRRMGEASQSDDQFLLYAPAFHVAIARASHNQMLVAMVKSFTRLLNESAPLIASRIPEAKDSEYRMHADLYEPILRQDAAEARRRMQLHLEESRCRVLRAYGNEESATR